MDKAKAEATMYAKEIMYLAAARRDFLDNTGRDISDGSDWPFVVAIEDRLRTLLDIEKPKPNA